MIIKDKQFDEERALYASRDVLVTNCKFTGPKDGESALKESQNVRVDNSYFNLRYPFWHDTNLSINSSEMTENCRAALWYSKDIRIIDSILNGTKAIRECENIELINTTINSKEFFWKSKSFSIKDSKVESEYPFFETENGKIANLELKAKYSFQYSKNIEITNSFFDTKDAFWHTENVTVKDSIIKGEYLGWYSNNLKLINCKIIGTQPLCYATNLTIEDCEMIDCDLSFEYSDVKAKIKGEILSIKNPLSGYIRCNNIKEIILDENKKSDSNCEITPYENVPTM